MKFSILITAVTFSLLSFDSNAQSTNIEWILTYGDDDFDMARKVTTDSNGDVITFGYYTGTVDFDPTSGVNEFTSQDSVWTQPDLYIQKTSSSGEVLWTNNISSDSREYPRGIITDEFDNIYFSISYNSDVDLDPGSNVELATSMGTRNMSIVKLSSSGDFQWAKTFDSSSGISGEELNFDNDGNILVTGSFWGMVDFDPGSGLYNQDAGNNSNLFVLKLDPNGDFIWARSFGSTSLDRGDDISVDSLNNVYITGYVDASFSNATVDFAPGMSITCSFEKKGFILKMDIDGNPLWLIQNGTNGIGLEFGNDGNFVVVGEFEGDVDFDPQGGSLILSSEVPISFMQKLTPNGELIWAKKYPGVPSSIELNQNDDIFITGRFEGIAGFGAASLDLISNGDREAYVARITSNGDIVWTRSIGGVGADQGSEVALDAMGNLYVVGYFSAEADFGAGAGVINSAGGEDAFLLKMSSAVSVAEPDLESSLDIFPNPSTDYINLSQAENTDWDIAIRDASGKVLLTELFQGYDLTLDVRQLSAGVYFLVGRNEHGSFTRKLVKQ